MTTLEHDTSTDLPEGGFGEDVTWSNRMADGHRIDLDGLAADEQLVGVDDAEVAAAARAQVRRLVDSEGRERGWLLFGQLRPGLSARLFDDHLRQREHTTLAAERAAGRAGDSLRLAEAPASARPPLDADLPVTAWPVTVLDRGDRSGGRGIAM